MNGRTLTASHGTLYHQLCSGVDHRVPLSEAKLLAPISDSEKVICIGMNYVDHCVEQNFPIPTEPIIFSKFANTIIASGQSYALTTLSQIS